MKKIEQIVIKDLSEKLSDSTIHSDWRIGTLENWADHANKMKTVIGVSSKILKSLVNEPTQEDDALEQIQNILNIANELNNNKLILEIEKLKILFK